MYRKFEETYKNRSAILTADPYDSIINSLPCITTVTTLECLINLLAKDTKSSN